MNSQFEIGQWIEATDGIGQVLYIRRIYNEKYSTEFFDGQKIGEHLSDILVIKLLCDHSGKIKTRNRIVAENAKFCRAAENKAKEYIENIRDADADSYTAYLFYDDKKDIGWSLSIFFKVPNDSVTALQESINEINKLLPSSFGFKEFLSVAKEQKLDLDFSEARKFVPGTGLNFSVIFFNRLYKVVGKQRIYTKVWSRVT